MKITSILQSVTGLLLASVFVATIQAGDLLQPEPGEELPGGTATTNCCTSTSLSSKNEVVGQARNAFMQPPPNMASSRGP